MNLKTVAGWAAIAFLIWCVIDQPNGAEQVVTNIGHFLTTAAQGISSYFSKV